MSRSRALCNNIKVQVFQATTERGSSVGCGMECGSLASSNVCAVAASLNRSSRSTYENTGLELRDEEAHRLDVGRSKVAGSQCFEIPRGEKHIVPQVTWRRMVRWDIGRGAIGQAFLSCDFLGTNKQAWDWLVSATGAGPVLVSLVLG